MGLLIGDEKRRGVAYVSEEAKNRLQPIGTAFFVRLEWGVSRWLYYAVTARHCVEEAVSNETVLFLEFSDASGYRSVKVSPSKWIRSDQTDVACCRIELQNIESISLEHHTLGPGAIWGGLRPGHDVFIIGLFSKAPYRDDVVRGLRIEPIVRFGKVSLAETDVEVYFDPRDEGKPEKAATVRARLIESVSFAGESGSPVFLHEEYTKDEYRSTAFQTEMSNPSRGIIPRNVSISDGEINTPLLGMISSHWTVESKAKSPQRRKHVADVGLNSGIAVVIPAEDIKEFLMNDPKMQHDRENTAKRKPSEPTTSLSLRSPEQE